MARVQLDNFKPSLTKQSFRDECNINKIIARYKQTNVISHQSVRKPIWGEDATLAAKSYEQAFDIVQQAQDAFASLPAKVRREFGNDPSAFCDFAVDPANLEQMRAWGLAPPAPDKGTQKASESASGGEIKPAQ